MAKLNTLYMSSAKSSLPINSFSWSNKGWSKSLQQKLHGQIVRIGWLDAPLEQGIAFIDGNGMSIIRTDDFKNPTIKFEPNQVDSYWSPIYYNA